MRLAQIIVTRSQGSAARQLRDFTVEGFPSNRILKKFMMEKRLRKICKQEGESMRLLDSQKAELEKAVEETEKLVEQTLAEESPAEVKIRMDIEELTGKMGLLNCQLVKVRITALLNIFLKLWIQGGKLIVVQI